MESLPLEIITKICGYLNQHDTLSLACATKWLKQLCLARIYEKVVVDSHYTQFSKEYMPYSTYINLLYNFKKFIRNRQLDRVRKLHVIGLPDLTNIYDAEVSKLLHYFFGSLVALQELVWLSDNFKLEYLNRLPNHRNLTRLEVNIKYLNYLCEHPSSGQSEYSFSNLSVLHIRPFLNLRRLKRLIDNLAGNGNQVRLKSLKLARFDRDTTVLVPPARELANPAILDPLDDVHHEYELNTVETLFAKTRIGSFDRLVELSLNNLHVCEKDADLMMKRAPLHKLKRLELKNVSEYGPAANGKVGILGKLTPVLSGLTELRLDFREASQDTVGGFLRGLPQLKALDLIVRINEIKKSHTNTATMFSEYALAISEMANLERFAIEIREENSFCDHITTTPTCIITSLGFLQQLRSVRLNAGDGTSSVQILLDTLAKLPHLEILDVFGARAGGAPNLGLGMIHPNVYDEWFKVQHVALLYWQSQPGIKYVRIHPCIFEITEGVANPRDGIEMWFESKVRVGWEQCADDDKIGIAW